MAEEVVIGVKAKDEASATINRVSASIGDLAKGSAVFLAMQKAAELAGQALRALGNFALDAAKAAEAQEASDRKLALSLANTGQLTRESFEALTAQAVQLQLTTKYTDDEVEALQAHAIALGNSAEEAGRFTEIALDMSTALGIDADTALKGLTQTMEGNVGVLGRFIPELQTMTKEQLKAGAAVELLAARFKGFAASEAQTVFGALTRLKNQFGEVQEAIGAAFTDNDAVAVAIEGFVEIMRDLAESAKENNVELKSLVSDGIAFSIDAIGLLIESAANLLLLFRSLRVALAENDLAWARFWKAIAITTTANKDFAKAIEEAQARLDDLSESAMDAANWAKVASDVRDRFGELAKRVRETADAQGDNVTAAERFNDTLRTTNERAKSVAETIATGIGSAFETAQAAQAEFTASFLASWEEIKNDITTQELLGTTANRPGGPPTEIRGQAIVEKLPDAAPSMMDSVMDSVGKGIGALRAGLSNTMEFITSTVGSLIGGAAGEFLQKAAPIIGAIFDVLQMTPEKLDETIKSFVKAFSAAIANIGPIIAVIADNLDEIIMALAEAIPVAVASVIANLPGIIAALVKSAVNLIPVFLTTIFGPFALLLSKHFREAIAKPFKGFENQNKEMIDSLGDQLNDRIESIGDFVSTITDGIASVGSSIGEAFGNLGSSMMDEFSAFAQLVEMALRSVFDFDWIGGKFDQLGKHVSRIFGAITDFVGPKFDAIGNAISERIGLDDTLSKLDLIGERIGSLFDFSISQYTTKFEAWVERTSDSFLDFMKQPLNFFVGLMNRVLAWLEDLPFINDDLGRVPTFADGGFVPARINQPMPIVAHGGELVLNQRQQSRLLDLIEGGGGSGRGAMNVTINEARSPGETVDALILAMRNGMRQGRINPAVLVGMA